MHLLQQLDGDLGVNLSRLQLGVAEQFLNDPHIGPVLQHVGGTGMAQEVAAACAPGMSLMNDLLDQTAQRAGAEPVSIAGQKQGLLLRLEAEKGPNLFQVTLQPGQRRDYA